MDNYTINNKPNSMQSYECKMALYDNGYVPNYH
jgi:hypothetical protein